MTQYWLKRTESSLPEGPFSAGELKHLTARGQITRGSFVSADNTSWVPASQVKGLLSLPQATPQADRGTPPSAAPVVQQAGASPYPVHQETKACPYCGEQILAVAIKCKHCGERFDTTEGSMAQVSACQACGMHFGERIPYNFYDHFRICKRCRNSLINRRAGAYLLDVLFVWVAALLVGVVAGFLAVASGASQRNMEAMPTLFGCFGWLA